ncbi:MAG: CoA-binding protein [Candidatus Bathyarchaeota archaeon]|nr:CoA-binding protein [Candidatus Bathyarchaeota archaeon]
MGLSRGPSKDSHRVAKYLKEQGFHIVPVNPLTISRIFPIPKSAPGSCITPIFQSKTLTEFIFGSFPLISGPSMFP